MPPVDREAIHQMVDGVYGVVFGMGGEMGISCGSKNAAVAENFLNLKNIHPGFN